MLSKRTVEFSVLGVLALGGVAAGTALAPRIARAQTAAHPSTDAPLSEDEKVRHVLNRLGFGPRPGDVAHVKALGLENYIDEQLHPETVDDSALEQKLSAFPALALSGDDLANMYKESSHAYRQDAQLRKSILAEVYKKDGMTDASKAATPGAPDGDAQKAKKAAIAKANPQERRELTAHRKDYMAKTAPVAQAEQDLVESKVVRAVESQRQLQEVMVDFWSNHFNIDARKGSCAILKIADDRDVIRKNSLGKFRDLLGASAHSPAMLVYLDNFLSTGPNAPQRARRRVAAKPGKAGKAKKMGGLNENYGREIMELHTLGVDGGYTQKDVTEVARCFTGWSIASQNGGRVVKGPQAVGGEFHFYPNQHDDGPKVVLGHTIPAGGGIHDGDEVLDILASHPATMRHVSFELCQRFVSDTPPTSLVDKCVATWQRTDGDIREIMRTIVTSPEFFSRAAYTHKIKSPFEYAVSSVRALGGTFDDGSVPIAGKQAAGKLKNGKALEAFSNASVAGEVGTMGEPIFQYQAPTGYPEDSHRWVSSGALISRLNFSLALTSGKIGEVTVPGFAHNEVPPTPTGQIVDHLAYQILDTDLAPATKQMLIHQSMNNAQNSADAMNVSAASNVSITSKLTALILGSPEFQRR